MNLIRCDACGTEVDPIFVAYLITPTVRMFGDRDQLHLCRSCWGDCQRWVAERHALFTETKGVSMTPDEIRSIVRDELASLGGSMLATHGPKAERANPTLAAVGGFLLAHYGGDQEQRGYGQGVVDGQQPDTSKVYRDPEPPAVGEPPTTTPGADDEPRT